MWQPEWAEQGDHHCLGGVQQVNKHLVIAADEVHLGKRDIQSDRQRSPECADLKDNQESCPAVNATWAPPAARLQRHV